jgi:hypothetical protein
LKVKNAKKWTARDLGQFLGRQSALERLVWDEVPLSARVEEEKERWIESFADKLAPNPKLVENAKRMEKWRPVFKQFIADTLDAATRRPYPESSAFLHAFGKANVIKPDDLASERRVGVGERIAYVMVLLWRPISKFESVGQLHRCLARAAEPMGIVITLKRVEKLCYRIGLKFKGRGRPKRKIQTNPPATS